MTIELPEEIDQLIEDGARESGYGTPEDYLWSLVIADRKPNYTEAEVRAARQKLEAKLLEASKGPFIPVDAGYFERKKQALRDRLAADSTAKAAS